MHADNVIKKISENTFEFEPNNTSLMATIVAPKKYTTEIQENILIAPGDPGSVDKGGLQERGKKLAISTTEKVSSATFITKLSIQKEQ